MKTEALTQIQDDAAQRGEDYIVNIWYPRIEGERIRAVQVGLIDVRAADNIRISYDFNRDGWRIEQASVFEWDGDDNVCDEGWKEVAFVQAWGSKSETLNYRTQKPPTP